jgi:hypothetical protein
LEFCRYNPSYHIPSDYQAIHPTSIPGKAKKFEVRKISHSYSRVISNFLLKIPYDALKTKYLENGYYRLLLERNTLAVSIPKPVTPIFDVYDPFNSAAILFEICKFL